METATSYFGTWEEIKAHDEELTGQTLVVKVIKDPVIAERLERFERGLARARELAKDLPPVPERQITLDFLYPDEEEPR